MSASAPDTTETISSAIEPIRAKASSRKGRGATVEHQARRPTQSRSQERFDLIIESLESLLQNANIEDISFHDIAAVAKISPSSINYLFPTMAALRMEMLKRYLEQSTEYHHHHALKDNYKKSASWAIGLHQNLLNFRNYIMANCHIAEILLGPALNREMIIMAMQENQKLARTFCSSLYKTYLLPEIPGLTEFAANAFECLDSIWRRTYAATGTIDDQTVEQSCLVMVSYLRNYIPERLQQRAE